MLNNSEVYMHLVCILILLLFVFVQTLQTIFDKNVNNIYKIITAFVAICAIYLATKIDTYLPFLGQTIVPPYLFSHEIARTNALNSTELRFKNVKDGTKVMYWAALKNDKQHQNPIEAYGDHSNSGVTTVSNNQATLYFDCPDAYDVGMFNKTLDKHVHYRLIDPDSSMISRVYTQKVKC